MGRLLSFEYSDMGELVRAYLGATLVPFQPSSTGYYVHNVNCTTQASAWTGGGFVNNPGVWARRIYNGM
jgi:hypothetical protein